MGEVQGSQKGTFAEPRWFHALTGPVWAVIRRTRGLGFEANARHVSAPAVRSKRSGAPPRRSARWETSLGPPAAVVSFARASRGSDPIQPATRLDGPVRPVQASGAAS